MVLSFEFFFVAFFHEKERKRKREKEILERKGNYKNAIDRVRT